MEPEDALEYLDEEDLGILSAPTEKTLKSKIRGRIAHLGALFITGQETGNQRRRKRLKYWLQCIEQEEQDDLPF